MEDNKNNSPTQNDLNSSMDKLTIGQFLRSKREKRNLTVKHLSQFTKINTTQLELLEKDLLSKLPNRAYVVGYVKAYAKALSISQEEALKHLEHTYRIQMPELPAAPIKMEAPQAQAQPTPTPSYTEEKEERKIPKEKIALLGVAGVMIAVTSLTLFFKKGNTPENEKVAPEIESTATPALPTPNAVTTKIPVQTPTMAPTIIATLLPTATAVPTKSLTQTPIPTKTPTAAPAQTTSASEVKTPAKVPQINLFPDIQLFKERDNSSPLERPSEMKSNMNSSGKIDERGVDAAKEEKKEETKEEKKEEKKEDKKDKKSSFFKIRQPLYQITHNQELVDKIPSNIKQATTSGNKQNVYIATGTGRTWITYKVDKEPVKQIFLKENAGVLLSGSEVRLFLGNANAATVYLNNQPVDLLLKRGIKNLVFPESSIQKYSVPLFIFDEQGAISPSDEYMKKKGLSPL